MPPVEPAAARALPIGRACRYDYPYRVIDGIYCLRANNPSPMSFEGTNTWVIVPEGVSYCAVVDPGTTQDGHLTVVCDFVEGMGRRITDVLATHAHSDHLSGGTDLAERCRARLHYGLGAPSRRGVLKLCEGALELRCVPLRGHSRDSVGLYYPEKKALFSGDVFFSRGWSLVCHPDGNLSDYFGSLFCVLGMIESGSVAYVLPGHREAMDAPGAKLRLLEYIEHRNCRLSDVSSVIRGTDDWDVDVLIDLVYGDIPTSLRDAARTSIAAQAEYLGLC